MGICKREMEVALVVIVAMSMVAAASAAISCGTVSGKLGPCVGYLTGPGGGAPSGGCCSGVKSLYALTQNNRADRITSCGCIKSLANALGNKLNPGNVAALPGKCGVNLGYSISVNTNCNSIP